jgi:hypothetical protein
MGFLTNRVWSDSMPIKGSCPLLVIYHSGISDAAARLSARASTTENIFRKLITIAAIL